MARVQIDVIAPMPEGWGLCQVCELLMERAELAQDPLERALAELPPEWRTDFLRLRALLNDLAARHRDRAVICVYDPRSLRGLIKVVRFGVRRYPTFVISGHTKISGWDVGALERALGNGD